MLDRAGKLCRKVLLKRPNHVQALRLLGFMAQQQNDPEAAVGWYRKAVAAKPDLAQAHNDLGAAFYACKRFDEAVASFRRAVAAKPDYAQAYRNLGIILKDCGSVKESVDAQRSAVTAQPSWHEARSGILLTCLCLDDHDPVTLLAEHRYWERMHAEHLASAIAPHTNSRLPDRRLRIGLVSPDFKEHPVIRFLMPFLEHHDREQIELFAYAQVAVPDESTERARMQVGHWRSLVNVPDTAAADLIIRSQAF